MMIKMTSKTFKYFNTLTRKIALSAFAFAVSTTVATAASSQWYDLGGGKARLVANLNPQTNVISGVLEVDLKPGWSTYWRYPGGSGIPPRFEFSKSSGVNIGEVKFPTPSLIINQENSSDSNQYDRRNAYAGYKKKVLFPFEADLLASSGGSIKLDLLMGVCEVICIPAQANMELDANKLFQSDPKAVQIISFAKLFLPKKADENDILLDVKSIDENTLMVKTKHSKQNGKPALFVEGPPEWYLTPAKLVKQEDDYSIFHVNVTDAPNDIDMLSEKLRFTLASGSKGIEIQR